jgi:hypothetical protein
LPKRRPAPLDREENAIEPGGTMRRILIVALSAALLTTNPLVRPFNRG